MRRTLAAFFVGSSVVVPAALRAADVPYAIFVDGRPVDAGAQSGLNRNGITFINVVRAVKTFDGLLTFGPAGSVRVSIGGQTVLFTVGRKTALLDDSPMSLPAAPFMKDGDTYVPLTAVAALGGAKIVIDAHANRATLLLGRGEVFAAPPTATPQDGEDVQPSPAQALSFVTSATVDGTALHARVNIKNTTGKRYSMTFPSDDQVGFVVLKNGSELWSSLAGVRPSSPTKMTIEPHATRTVTADWAGFGSAGVGRYTLRARLMTLIPIDLEPLSLGSPSPAPTAPG